MNLRIIYIKSYIYKYLQHVLLKLLQPYLELPVDSISIYFRDRFPAQKWRNDIIANLPIRSKQSPNGI